MINISHRIDFDHTVIKTGTGYKKPIGWDGLTLKPNMWADCTPEEVDSWLAQNEPRNRGAEEKPTTPETEACGSGSRDCSAADTVLR